MIYNTLLDENFPSCIRAVFELRESAEAAAGRLRRATGVKEEQLRIVNPKDSTHAPAYNTGIDTPGSRGRGGFFLRSFMLGLLAGALFGTAMVAAGLQAPPSHPGALIIACSTLGILAALSLAGLTSWRSTSPGPLTHPPASPEEHGFALEIEVHDLSEQLMVRRALAGLGVQVELSGTAGSRTVPHAK